MKISLLLCICGLAAGPIEKAVADDVATSPNSTVWKPADVEWSGGCTASAWKLTAWPGRDMVVASVRSSGLWSTTDGGATWKHMGEPGKCPPNNGEACTFVFDPTDSHTMWTAGMYGYGVWKTSDGGKTFAQLGKKDHVDGISVDFTDSQRKTVLIGLHEQEHSLQRSTDGGVTWEGIGDKVPPDTAFTSDPIVVDAKTYITNSAGYKKNEPWGIYRSEDAGQTWKQVSKEGASGSWTTTSKDRIFWSCLWDKHIITSADKGNTWTKVSGPVRGNVLEIAPNRLVALGGKDLSQLYVSKDDAATWTPFGPPVHFKAHGFVYNAARNAIFVWEDRAEKPRINGSIVRWDLPKDIDAALSQQPAAP